MQKASFSKKKASLLLINESREDDGDNDDGH